MKTKEIYSKKLLVEGNDDQHVIWSLCEKYSIKENFDVIDSGGFTALLQQTPIRLKVSGIDTVGIILDADENIGKRWEETAQVLSKVGYIVPDHVDYTGVILVQDDLPRFGIWLMPNNQDNGMLEDFIRFLVPSDDSLIRTADSVLDNIEQNQLNKYSFLHKSKALIHTWLAWQEDPGTPMGLAITKRYLTTDQLICQRLVTWLRELFK